MFETLSDTLILVFEAYAAVMAFIFVFLLVKWRINRDKLQIRVLTESGPRIFLRKVEPEGNRVYMEKPKKKGVAWSIEFSQTYPVRSGFLGMTRRNCIDVYPGASKGITRNYRARTEDAPTYGRSEASELFWAGVIKASGQTGQKLEIPFFLYLILFVLAILTFITFLASIGVLKTAGPV